MVRGIVLYGLVNTIMDYYFHTQILTFQQNCNALNDCIMLKEHPNRCFNQLKNKFVFMYADISFKQIQQSLVTSYSDVLFFSLKLHKGKKIAFALQYVMTVMVSPFSVDVTAATVFASFSTMNNSSLLLSWSPVSSVLNILPGLFINHFRLMFYLGP